MSSPKIPFTITYKKPGIEPPLFLAGSFSEPEWEPKEMECTSDEDGEHIFQSEIMAEPGTEYQFKLRVGKGDWWVLSEDFEVVTDASGNQNNILNILSSDTKKGQAPPPPTTSGAKEVKEDLPSTPGPQVQVPGIETSANQGNLLDNTSSVPEEEDALTLSKDPAAPAHSEMKEDLPPAPSPQVQIPVTDAPGNQDSIPSSNPEEEEAPTAPAKSEAKESLPPALSPQVQTPLTDTSDNEDTIPSSDLKEEKAPDSKDLVVPAKPEVKEDLPSVPDPQVQVPVVDNSDNQDTILNTPSSDPEAEEAPASNEPAAPTNSEVKEAQPSIPSPQDQVPVADDSSNQDDVLNTPSSDSKEEGAPTTIKEPAVPAKSEVKEELPSVPSPQVQIPELNDKKGPEDDLKTPLFAHECLGPYDFAVDESEEEACPSISAERDVKLRSDDYNTENVDLNDPTLEKFPSDRGSIMDTIRNIQTHLNEDHTDGSSPRVVSPSRPSTDSTDADEANPPPASLSPSTPRRRDQRLSHSSIGRSRSAVSLGSIAEEPKPDNQSSDENSSGEGCPPSDRVKSPAVITLANPNTASVIEEPRSPPSEEDEAVAMKSSEAVSNGKADKADKAEPSPSVEKEPTLDQSNKDANIAPRDEPEKPTGSEPRSTTDQEHPDVVPSEINKKSPELSEGLTEPSENTASRTLDSQASSHSEMAQTHNTVGKWLRGLLNGPLSNKLPLILTTGAVVFAVGINWLKGSDK